MDFKDSDFHIGSCDNNMCVCVCVCGVDEDHEE